MVGRAIYDRAFLAAAGKPLAELASISGRTESDIMAERLRINGIEPTAQRIESLADALIRGYDDAREEMRRVGRALPGARATLAELAAETIGAHDVVRDLDECRDLLRRIGRSKTSATEADRQAG
ncbi:hypothetical protein [Gandjariella thermophila]|uniref:Uncharacterized protein n=1 Tax=Gandjariella thermophila TaxID=1931992 RepID=A0A4D4J3X0_9PSEU|nr:hypothetical protein [Gandjariella thermophila]GDY29772.1 hypothetical protein GTS_14050 [Gandjariella thermophila]